MKEDTKYELQQKITFGAFKGQYTSKEVIKAETVKSKSEWETLLGVDLEYFGTDWFKKVEEPNHGLELDPNAPSLSLELLPTDEPCILDSEEFDHLILMVKEAYAELNPILVNRAEQALKSFLRENKEKIE